MVVKIGRMTKGRYIRIRMRIEHWKNVFTSSITARFPICKLGVLQQNMYTWYEKEGVRCPWSKISQASMMPSALAVKYTLGLYQVWSSKKARCMPIHRFLAHKMFLNAGCCPSIKAYQ